MIRAGAKKWEDRPIWFDVYSAFPPKHEPRFDRAPVEKEVTKLIYPDDIVRAQYMKEIPRQEMIDMETSNPTQSQRFVELYKEKLKDSEETAHPREVFQTAFNESKATSSRPPPTNQESYKNL